MPQLMLPPKEPIKTKPPTCVACGDTGKASNGQVCVPCWKSGRIKEEPCKDAR